MPVLIQTDLRTTRVQVPLSRSDTLGAFAVDRQMVEDLQNYDPGWTVWGEKLNDLSPLHPYKHFRDLAMKSAQRYVSDLTAKGWSLLTNEGDCRVWGPCLPRNWAKAGNRYGVTESHAEDEAFLGDHYDFFIDGQWLARTYLTEMPQVQAQHRTSKPVRTAINQTLWPHRRMK